MDHKKYIAERLLDWEKDNDSFAPLTELQIESINELAKFIQERPLPKELPFDDDVFFNPKISSSKSVVTSSPLGDQVVENSQQFLLWYSDVEEKIAEDKDIFYKAYVEELCTYRTYCSELLNNVSSALGLLETLQNKYTFVSDKTNALHEACEHLLAEQAKLVNSAESVSEKLCYFNELDTLSQKLASPTLSVVNESFVPLLSQLDECIAYLLANEHFKEAHVYLARFRQLQTTALGMIRSYVTTTLQQATQHILPKRETLAPSENAFTLYYGKFRSYAPRILALMKQIEERAEKNTDYQPLLEDCHQCYFNQREILLGPSVSVAITDLATNHQKDHCSLVRSGCAFLLHVCEDEYQLFRQFFTQRSKRLDDFLESLCMRLYDVFRPVIIHINHLETLAELCGILKVEMLEEHMQFGAHELAAFETVILQMLEDVQERLVYRTHIYMKTDILNYNPASGDLAYPEKLEMMESIAESLMANSLSRSNSQISVNSLSSVSHINNEKNSSDKNHNDPTSAVNSDTNVQTDDSSVFSKTTYSPADLHGMWYPTVRRTLVCLSKLYRCLDKTIFQGLSQEVLTTCIQSLVVASDAIAKRKANLDGELFQIKHLLILREQIGPFQIDFAIKETTLDFSNVRVAAYGLLRKKSQLLALNSTNSLLEFLLQGAPHVTEHFIDSKKAIDKQLKLICEEFINNTSGMIVGPLQQFLDKAKCFNEMQASNKVKDVFLSSQPFANADKVSQLIIDTIRHMKSQLPALHRSMSLYLANPDTEYILFRPVKLRIQMAFEQLLQIIRVSYNEDEQIIIACPSTEQISMLLTTRISKS